MRRILCVACVLGELLFALTRPVLAEPGTLFTYGPTGLQVFHELLRGKLHGEAPTRFLERRVLRIR